MVGKASFSEEFKRDAVAQITERGYSETPVGYRAGFHPLWVTVASWPEPLIRQARLSPSQKTSPTGTA